MPFRSPVVAMVPADETHFRKATDELLPWRTRMTSLTIAALMTGFVLVDLVTLRPEDTTFRFIVRLSFVPVYLAIAGLSRRRFGARHPQALVLVMSAMLAIELGVVTSRLPAAESIGFFPAMLFLATFLPLPRWKMCVELGLFPVGFLCGHLALGVSSWEMVLKQGGNLVAAGCVAMVAAHLAERSRRSEFVAGLRLGEANRQLLELDRFKNKLFADVSHELRTPLAAALLALEGAGPDQASRGALLPLRRLRGLVETLLELIELDAGRVQPTGLVSDLNACSRGLADEFSSAFEARGIALRLSLPKEALHVPIGRDALEKIVVNLLGNALKYTLEGGQVDLVVREEAAGVVLEVKDNGPGIAAEALPHVFERFFRVQPGGEARGSGIGLALAKELAELNGGRITVGSVVGEGTSFCVHFPRASLPVTSSTAPGRSHERLTDVVAGALDGLGHDPSMPRAPLLPSPGKPLVLVVEDHVELGRRIAEALSPEHSVVLAHDGPEGLRLARALAPDLVVSDLMIPGFDGLELVRRLREDVSTRLTPVLMLSALADQAHIIAGLKAGADGYMLKPFERELLRTRVESLVRVRRRRQEAAAVERLSGTACEALALALGIEGVAILRAGPAGELVATASGGSLPVPVAGWGHLNDRWVTATSNGGVAVDSLPPALAAVAHVAVAALTREERTVGLVVAFDRRPGLLDARTAQALLAAATYITARLDRDASIDDFAKSADDRQRLLGAVLSGQESERRRLARDLHDGTGQVLIAALLRVDLSLQAPDPQVGRDQLELGRRLISDAIEDLRAFSRDLHPPTLTQFGLVETLRVLAASVNSASLATSAELDASLPAELRPEIAIGLYRIAQAALANTVRHAHAHQAVLRLTKTTQSLVLEVEDDGNGFEPSGTVAGVGLLSIRERTASLGGTVDVRSAIGRGTTVRVTVPIRVNSGEPDLVAALSMAS